MLYHMLTSTTITNITLVRVKLGSDSLIKVSGSRIVVGKKNVVEQGEPTEGGPPASMSEISHR